MEFEFTGTVYIDVENIYEICSELHYIATEDIYKVACNLTRYDDYVEGWMIDKVVTEVKKMIDKELEN